VDLVANLLGRADQSGDIPAHQPPTEGLVEGAVEDATEVVHSAGRQPGLQLAIQHFLDLIGGEAAEPDPAEVGNEVVPHHSGVALIGRGPHRGTGCVLQPPFEEVGNCLPLRWRDTVLLELRQGGGWLGGCVRPGPGVAIQLPPRGGGGLGNPPAVGPLVDASLPVSAPGRRPPVIASVRRRPPVIAVKTAVKIAVNRPQSPPGHTNLRPL